MTAAVRRPWAVAGVAALLTAAAVVAPPANADTTDAAFLSALTRAGVVTANPVDTVALGRQVCPMLVGPGKDFAKVVSKVRNDGVPPDVAAFFAGLAIQMYCPSMMSSIGNGTFLNWLQTARLR